MAATSTRFLAESAGLKRGTSSQGKPVGRQEKGSGLGAALSKGVKEQGALARLPPDPQKQEVESEKTESPAAALAWGSAPKRRPH